MDAGTRSLRNIDLISKTLYKYLYTHFKLTCFRVLVTNLTQAHFTRISHILFSITVNLRYIVHVAI